MIDTLLQIGKVLRTKPEKLYKYHPHIKPYKFDSKTDKVYEVDVDENMNFDMSNIKEILDEDKINNLYYYHCKTSSMDTYKRFVFGDINFKYFDGKTIEHIGDVLTNEINSISNKYPEFINSIRNNIDIILSYVGNNYIHFNFNGNSWYELDNVVDDAIELYIQNYTIEQNGKFVYEKSAYSFIGGFNYDENKVYTQLSLDKDDLLNIIYAQTSYNPIKYLGTDYCIIFLPLGENINYDALTNFIKEKKYTTKIEENLSLENSDDDLLFSDITVDEFNDIRFDVIIQKKGSNTNQNLLYIPMLQKSNLIKIHNKHRELRKCVEIKYNTDKYKISFWNSLKIFFDEKSYTNFLMKCVYEIYSEKYVNNLLLNNQFITKVERSIRDDKFMYNYYKINFDYLKLIENKNIDDMKNEMNFKLGHIIGVMSHCARNDNYKYRENLYAYVNNFAGQISKKVLNIKDVIKYVNDIQQKIELNEYYFNRVDFANYLDIVKNFDVKFDKESFILGFFDGYYEKNEKVENKN
jgi:hypothetical protein